MKVMMSNFCSEVLTALHGHVGVVVCAAKLYCATLRGVSNI